VLLSLGLAGYVSFDLLRTLRTGRAHGKFRVFTSKKQPAAFRRYVYADWIVLAFCVVVIMWILIWPEISFSEPTNRPRRPALAKHRRGEGPQLALVFHRVY
jgi:hypothetical protein